MRLTNPMEQTFITPFQNDEYNWLAPLCAYIKDYRDSVEELRAGVDELSFVPRAIEKADSWDALFDLAEVVVKVEIHDFHLADKYFGYAYVKVLEQYKDGQLRNESLIVPAHIQPNQIHIMFLTELGVPVTRQGSIYSEDHAEYQDILNWLQKKID